MQIIYQPKTENWALVRKICNTNNHRIEDNEPNSDKLEIISEELYNHTLEQTNKSEWIKYFPDPVETIQININSRMCKNLYEAIEIGFIKQERSALHKDELDEIEKYIEPFLPTKIKKWFIRIDEASPKDGKYGAGPMLSARDMVTSLATSLRIYRALHKNLGKSLILYLVPWREDYNEFLEFRVFIHNQRVTCMSQYVWSKKVGFNKENICILAPAIVDFCNDKIIPVFPLQSYVVDITIIVQNPIIKDEMKIPVIDDETVFNVELVEFNSFGAEFASGSALFHWLNDYHILYGAAGDVYVRYVE